MDHDCHGSHRFFVADVAQVPAEGKVVVLALCTSCGSVIAQEKIVTTLNNEFKILQKYKTKE